MSNESEQNMSDTELPPPPSRDESLCLSETPHEGTGGIHKCYEPAGHAGGADPTPHKCEILQDGDDSRPCGYEWSDEDSEPTSSR